ncbi:DUF397 domain-containing protein [Kitasatospora sp. NBC_00070]|uniref:DUF397 domain-containing protein n=1 Tax=Kitasatospora sp. NBC_00070 TaxID=2975962 RepID=UPI003251739A
MSNAVEVLNYNPPAFPDLSWIKSDKSNVNQLDDSIGFALMADGNIAIGITTDESQTPIVSTPTKLRAMIAGAKDGQFDHLVA